MGGLRPIGSEKLDGMDKIRRIMEIATYDVKGKNTVNEDKENVFSVRFADGIKYVIEKKNKVILLKNLLMVKLITCNISKKENIIDHILKHLKD